MSNIYAYGGSRRSKGESGIERLGKVIGGLSSLRPSLPESEFGKVFTGFYHKGRKAIEKLLQERQGQITGAFYKKDIGDIDLVWGKVTDAKKQTGLGLAHILNKHPDFDVKKIPTIIKKGTVSKTYNGFNITYKNYLVGINKGWNENGVKTSTNNWVVTSYEKK